MKRGWTLAGLAIAIGLAGAARAADWAPAAIGSDAATYDADLSSVALNGSVVKSWMRHVLPRPERDPKTGAQVFAAFQERFDDCANHRFMLGPYLGQDGAGKVVASGPGDVSHWVDILPGSVAEGYARTVCAVANPPKEQPIEANLHEGSWTDLGASADGKFHLQVRIDDVVKLRDGPVIAVWRSLYDKPEWVEGFAVRIVVSASAIDCAAGKSAKLGADFFISPNVRVRAVRVADKDIRFTTPGPNSYLAKSIQLICASAVTEKAQAGGEAPQEGGFSVGTAWGVNKGYLVTAAHVVAGGRRIFVYDNGERVGEARVVAGDRANDLAVLKFTPAKPGKIHILPIAPKAAALGRNIFVLGYPAPDVMGQHIKMTAGQVSSTAGMEDDARFLQISAPVQPGNSGGPVIGWDGSVVGVVESGLTRLGEGKDEPAPQNVNYALKASYVRPMLDDLPDLANYVAVKPAADHDQMVAEARKAVFMVVVTP